MREWGTVESVAAEANAEAYFAHLKVRFPETPSAYRASGKLPLGGVVSLAAGSVLASVAAALTGILAGGISLVLFALMGFLIAIIAFCGFVACITLIWGLGIAVVGGAATFGGLGWVAGEVTARVGKVGKNRNATAAVVASLPATLVAWCALAACPPLVAAFVPPSDEDFSLGGLVHLFGDYGWVHGIVLALGLLFAFFAAYVAADEAVRAQLFCEPCQEYMVKKLLPGASLAVGDSLLTCVRTGNVVGVVELLRTDTGSDLQPSLHHCPKCGAGIFEAKLWAKARWVDAKGAKDRAREWRAWSIALSPEAALPLRRLPEPRDE